jgi:micrococcal nuclease
MTVATQANPFICTGLFLMLLSLGSCSTFSMGEERGPIRPERAGKYIGKTKTVCGIVASSLHDEKLSGKPTFLNLNRPFPDQIFTVLIWGTDRPKFSEPPEKMFQGKRVCVTGVITVHDRTPQIAISDPSQITLESD